MKSAHSLEFAFRSAYMAKLSRYYGAYLAFFTREAQAKGIAAVLEEFVFSPKANLGPDPNAPHKDQPQMLSRFVSGLIHPMIHTGHGTEFGLPGMLVEGLPSFQFNEG